MWQWRINILGEFFAWSPNGPVGSFRVRKCEELLALLALYPAGKTRIDLAAALWPQEPQQVQLSHLRYALSMVRKAFGNDPFITKGNTYLALIPAVRCDALEWRMKLSVALNEPKTSRRVDLLEVLFAGGLPQLLPQVYATWADLERHPWNAMVANGVVALAWGLAHLCNWDSSLRWVRVGEEEFPEREDDWESIRIYIDQHRETVRNEYFAPDEKFLEVRSWLRCTERQHRLITITGLGGIGKTRLAREASAGIDLVIVELADCTRLEHAWDRLRLALKLNSSDTAEELVITGLNEPGAPTLLLLDNLEQFGSDGSVFVTTILENCPAVNILVTSQRKLDISYEYEVSLEPLTENQSVNLFLARARCERADFAAFPDAERKVWDICALLGGVPLAIELAAARACLLGPSQIYELLEDTLKFLVTRREELQQRHRSVRAALDWSVGLLSPEVRKTLAILSLFHGSCAPEAVLHICGYTSLDDLDELQARSLVQVQFVENESSRYSLLRIINDYAKRLLTQEEENLFSSKALEYFAALAEKISVADAKEARRIFHGDRDNFLSILATESAKNPMYWLKRLGKLLVDEGHWKSVRKLITLAQSEISEVSERIQLLGLAGALERSIGNESVAQKFWLERLELCRSESYEIGIADSLIDLAVQSLALGDMDQAWKQAGDGLAYAESLQHHDFIVSANLILAEISVSIGSTDVSHYVQMAQASIPKTSNHDYYKLFYYYRMMKICRLKNNYVAFMEYISLALDLSLEMNMVYTVALVLREFVDWCEPGLEEKAASASASIFLSLGSRKSDEIIDLWADHRKRNGEKIVRSVLREEALKIDGITSAQELLSMLPAANALPTLAKI